MTIGQESTIRDFCERYGIYPPFEIARIVAGRNNELHIISNPREKWVVKKYIQSDGDNRDRLATEFGFLTYLERIGVATVAQPIGADSNLLLALYTFVEGKRPTTIFPNYISQAVQFIKSINSLDHTASAQRLPLASHACFTLEEHIALIDSRLDRLVKIQPSSAADFAMRQFVDDKLLPAALTVKTKLQQALSKSNIRAELTSNKPIISPSDFGFHNMLENAGKLYFFDFEYSGWDDPAKLICDFICQPEIPLTAPQEYQFIQEFSDGISDSGRLERRVELLLPLHRLKWCCIILNEFISEAFRRRSQAGLQTSGLLELQLNEAKRYFAAHCYN